MEKNCQDVIKLGCLETTRSISLEYHDIEICLDKNIYLEKEDYEMEIEYKSEYPGEVVDNFRRLGIDVNKEVHGKFSRFMYAKNESIAKVLKRDK